MSRNAELPIAVVDSGVGGISVLRELLRIMPNENYIYYGDSKNAPYGQKSKSEVLEITKNNLKYLKGLGIKALVIACNTATSAAAQTLREENPELPIIGIEPAVKPAAKLGENPCVLVMATPLTLQEEKFRLLAERFADREEIIPLPCPGLVELIEADDKDGTETYLEKLFAPYAERKVDAVVLGCTHYPHVRRVISRHIPEGAVILDGGEGTARHTYNRLAELGLLRRSHETGKIRIINTSTKPRLPFFCKQLLYKKG